MTRGELNCDAIMEDALSPEYIGKWNTWNGNEIDNQIRNGINHLYSECREKAVNNEDRIYLENLYSKVSDKFN